MESEVNGRLPKKLVPHLLDLYLNMKKGLNRDGSNMALYGRAEASRLWFLHLTVLLVKLGYIASKHDKRVPHKHANEGIVIILRHVDV